MAVACNGYATMLLPFMAALLVLTKAMAFAPWSVAAMVLISWLLTRHTATRHSHATPQHATPQHATPRPSHATMVPPPALVLMSNYSAWVKVLVPKLQQVTSRLLVVSNQPELSDFCSEVSCDFVRFPLCADNFSFARICRDDATYRAQVEEVYEALRHWAPDVLLTVGFHVLPKHAVTIPKKVALNFHPSKLPYYRGGLPLQAQILRGESHLECCVHVMTDVIDDSRDVLLRGGRLSLEGKTTGMVFEDLQKVMPSFILEALDLWQSGMACCAAACPSVPAGELPHGFGVKVDTWIECSTGEKKRSNAGVFARVRIEWQEDTALDIERACRAFTLPGFKGLFTDYEGEACRVTHCAILAEPWCVKPPGTVLWGEANRCAVATVDGAAVLLSLEMRQSIMVGRKFESVTPVSTWLQKRSDYDWQPGGKRFH